MKLTHDTPTPSHSISGSFFGFGNRHRFAMFRAADPDPSPSPSPDPSPTPASITADTELPEALRTQLGTQRKGAHGRESLHRPQGLADRSPQPDGSGKL